MLRRHATQCSGTTGTIFLSCARYIVTFFLFSKSPYLLNCGNTASYAQYYPSSRVLWILIDKSYLLASGISLYAVTGASRPRFDASKQGRSVLHSRQETRIDIDTVIWLRRVRYLCCCSSIHCMKSQQFRYVSILSCVENML